MQTQVLPYLKQLSPSGIEVSLLTFEPHLRRTWTKPELEEQRSKLEKEGIRWFYLPYHKRPSVPATFYDIMAGALKTARLVRKHEIDVLHARGHIAAAIGALAKLIRRSRLIFDIRGFMPEEYTDAGVWPEGGLVYRRMKSVERRLMKSADAFVVLTEKAREILFPGCTDRDALGRPLEVIPCCVDVERFRRADDSSRDQLRGEANLQNRRVFVYVGALGGWYLTKEMADFLATAHQMDEKTFSLILTQSPPEMIERHFRKHGIAKENYLIRKVAPEEIPRFLSMADIALSFIKPCYSKLASSPTKMAEYLASGLPVISNAGIGDVDRVLEEDRVGVLLREFNQTAYLETLGAVEELVGNEMAQRRSRASAEARFDLEKIGGRRYRRLYQRLTEEQTGALRDRCGDVKDKSLVAR